MKLEMDEVRSKALECVCRLFSGYPDFNIEDVQDITIKFEEYILSGHFQKQK